MKDRLVISQRPYVKLLHHQYYKNNNEMLALSLIWSIPTVLFRPQFMFVTLL